MGQYRPSLKQQGPHWDLGLPASQVSAFTRREYNSQLYDHLTGLHHVSDGGQLYTAISPSLLA